MCLGYMSIYIYIYGKTSIHVLLFCFFFCPPFLESQTIFCDILFASFQYEVYSYYYSYLVVVVVVLRPW